MSGYIYLGAGITDRREMLHDGTYVARVCLLPFWGGAPFPNSEMLGLNFGYLAANISKTVSRSIISTTAF